jgi:hypothetical protein
MCLSAIASVPPPGWPAPGTRAATAGLAGPAGFGVFRP